jgi:ABC-type branched-subunit amino acid transport system substrate-binding protein
VSRQMKRAVSILTKAAMAGAIIAGAITTLGGPAGAAGGSSAPGVTSKSITVGSISTQTGPIAANFSSLIYGEEAYFNFVNALGGINGRKINYAYKLDDGGNSSTFTQLANTLINQDHVFAVTGVATAFFTPNIFVEAKIPTYGYNVTENWAGPPNLFAAGGSVIYLPAEAVGLAYLADKVHAKSIALLAYGVASSAAACAAGALGLAQAGYKVSYTDFKINYPGTTVATDVQRMKQAGSDMVVSCMDVQGNITMARAIQQYGLKITQLWLSGNDQTTLDQNKSLMQGVYFDTFHVPFSAPTAGYPGLKLYLAAMKRFEPKYVYDEVAIQGWMSAALFVQGLKAAGKNPTQAAVINADNQITNFTANGLTTPTNWKYAGHAGHAPPYCGAYIKVVGDKYVPALNTSAKSVYVCFGSINAKHPKPVAPPAGTPTG